MARTVDEIFKSVRWALLLRKFDFEIIVRYSRQYCRIVLA